VQVFRPNVPAKIDPRKRSANGAASSSAAAKDSEAFRELIKQAQSDKGWQDKARQNRPQHAPIHVRLVSLFFPHGHPYADESWHAVLNSFSPLERLTLKQDSSL